MSIDVQAVLGSETDKKLGVRRGGAGVSWHYLDFPCCSRRWIAWNIGTVGI
jgi:hypothetical protein